ncbi:MAG: DUF2236 domain-containing protein, partial [Mycolicibacterium hassiacum]|nr:DUF2236 domain-containing protein [Mycolicibacterium hassiacum]
AAAAGPPAARALVKALSVRNFGPAVAVARYIAPTTAEVLAAHLRADPPAQRRTVTPAEVRERLPVRA